MAAFTNKCLVTFEDRPKIFLDTEYSATAEASLCMPICWCAMDTNNELYTGDMFDGFREDVLQRLVDTHTIVCHAGGAELGFLHALGINISKVQIIDTLIEWRLMTNNHKKYSYGKIISGGRKCFSKPPIDQEEKKKNQKLTTPDGERLAKSQSDVSLRAFVYKVSVHYSESPIEIDADHKETMRQYCIDYNIDELRAHMEEIVKYCMEDTDNLRTAYNLLCKDRQYLDLRKDNKDLERGQLSINLHKVTVEGIPVDVDKLNKLAGNAEALIQASKDLCNELTGLTIFRDKSTFQLKKSGDGFTKSSIDRLGSFNKQVFTEYIQSRYRDFPLTAEGAVSTAGEDLELYDFDPVCYQLRQTNKSIKCLQALLPNKSNGEEKDDYLFNHIGSDGRLRVSNWGAFGTQTGRQAPKASQFILAMSKWLRSLMTPPKGWAMVEVDYSSQESLLAGIVYNDKNIIEGYVNGDPYISFGELAGIVPKGATKKTHPEERKQLKAVTLGKSYGLGVKGLGLRLATELWKGASSPASFAKEWQAHIDECTQLAYELDRAYKEVYWDMQENREQAWMDFEDSGYIETCRYWRVWDALPFKLSILNAPVQGLGASIYHRMSYLLTNSNVPEYVKTFSFLHDAAYCLVRIDKLTEGTEFICKQMLDACKDVVVDPRIKHMRVGIDIISPELSIRELDTVYGKAVVAPIFFADENAEKSYKKFYPYLVDSLVSEW